MGRDAQGAGAAGLQRVAAQLVALRARSGVRGHRISSPAAESELQKLHDAWYRIAVDEAAAVLAEPGRRGARAGARSARGRDRGGARPASTPPSRISNAPSGSRTASSTRSPPSSTIRRATRSAPCCSRPAVRPKPKRSTGRTCGASAKRLGAVRPAPGVARAEQDRRSRAHRGAVQEGVGARRRDADGVALRP